jgi:hypothetical protein
MLGRCELSDRDFGAVSIARGNNQGIKGQVFRRATLSTGTPLGSLAAWAIASGTTSAPRVHRQGVEPMPVDLTVFKRESTRALVRAK